MGSCPAVRGIRAQRDPATPGEEGLESRPGAKYGHRHRLRSGKESGPLQADPYSLPQSQAASRRGGCGFGMRNDRDGHPDRARVDIR